MNTLHSFILQRNLHKIRTYDVLEQDDIASLDEHSKLINDLHFTDFKKNGKERVTERSFPNPNIKAEAKLYQEILQSSVEYFDLFLVNRPIQTQSASVPEIKRQEEAFVRIKKSIEDWTKTLNISYNEKQAEATREIVETMNAILKDSRMIHIRSIDRVRRSYRSMLHDMYSKITAEARNELTASHHQIRTAHVIRVDSLERELLDLKKICRNIGDDISKTRTLVSKFQLQIKKNNLMDIEAFSINDEKIKAEGLIDFFHSSISSREEKIRDISFNIQIMEVVIDAMDTGMSILNIPSYLISGKDFNELKRIKSAMTSKYAKSTDPFRMIDGFRIPIHDTYEYTEETLEDILVQAEDEATLSVQEKEFEIQELNAMYAEKYEKLQEKQRVRQKRKIKAQLTRHWDQQGRSNTHNLLQEMSSMRERVQKVYADKAVFSDINGPSGIETKLL